MHRNSVFFILLIISAALVLMVFSLKIASESRTPSSPKVVTTPPSVTPDDPVIGPENARVTIIEFGDFQCIFCKSSRDTLAAIRSDYLDDVRIVWKDFPDSAHHAQALPAARAARCAQDQGKFWEYHDLLFANQELLSASLYTQIATALELKMDIFQSCLERPAHAVISRGLQEGLDRGISAIPHFFFNTVQKSGSVTYTELDAIIKDILNENPGT